MLEATEESLLLLSWQFKWLKGCFHYLELDDKQIAKRLIYPHAWLYSTYHNCAT